MSVIVTNEIKVEISFDGGTNYVTLPEATTINHTSDIEVVEYSTLGSKFKKRVATGGKTNDYSFECKVFQDNTAKSVYKELLAIYKGESLGNGISIKLEQPRADGDTSKAGEIREITGVLKVTAFGGQGADDLAEANLEFMSSGEPTITDEAS